MKMKFLVTGVLCAIGAGAHAQSSVTIYGLISTAITRTNNSGGSPLYALMNGPMQTSRLGFKGTEDLGGGTKVFFVLENGFNVDTGAAAQGGRLFGRTSLVGLENKDFGSILLGRQYDQMSEQMCGYEAACQFAGNGTHIGDNDNLFQTYRVNNAITYKSPVINGMQANVQYGSADDTTSSNNRAYSASVKYQGGGLSIAAGMNNLDRPASTTNANGAVSGDYGFSSPFATSHASGAAVARHRAAGVGAQYKLGATTFLANYTSVVFTYLDSTRTDLSNYEVAVSQNLTSSLLVGAGYVLTKGTFRDDGQKPKWHQLNTGIVYSLSKRTDIYANYIYQRAAGDATFAQIYTQARSSGRSQSTISLGLRYRF